MSAQVSPDRPLLRQKFIVTSNLFPEQKTTGKYEALLTHMQKFVTGEIGAPTYEAMLLSLDIPSGVQMQTVDKIIQSCVRQVRRLVLLRYFLTRENAVFLLESVLAFPTGFLCAGHKKFLKDTIF